ncbi:unnamed protein product [Camellia sinensis]
MGKSFLDHAQITVYIMGWLSKIFKGSSHKVSEGKYNRNVGYGEDTLGCEPSSSGMHGQRLKILIMLLHYPFQKKIEKVKTLLVSDFVLDNEYQLKDDEQLAKAIQESLNVESPPQYPQYGNENIYQPIPFPYSTGFRICAGCNTEIGHGRFLNCMGAIWHPGCFRCHGCNQPICDYEFSMSGNYPYHKYCYKEHHHPKCDVCKHFCYIYQGHSCYAIIVSKSGNSCCVTCYAMVLVVTGIRYSRYSSVIEILIRNGHYVNASYIAVTILLPLLRVIPTNAAGLIEYRAHPFWIQKYCPFHEHDGTPRCCSCERIRYPQMVGILFLSGPRETRYVALDDGRKVCLECLDSTIMDTNECQPLYLDIQEFYEGLNMKVEQQVPLLLVERQALNEAMDGDKTYMLVLSFGQGHHHMPETRGLCLSEEQTVSTILSRPIIGTRNRAMNMITEPYTLTRRCEVTAILILYGLPRLLTGSILAHEMMHAWLRLNGYRILSQDVEEGICQVLAHMWLESQIMSISGSNVASTSSSAPVLTLSKQGTRSPFERKLGEFFKHQIESDTSPVYGNGFRAGNQAVLKYGLWTTLEHIRLTGTFPY